MNGTDTADTRPAGCGLSHSTPGTGIDSPPAGRHRTARRSCVTWLRCCITCSNCGRRSLSGCPTMAMAQDKWTEDLLPAIEASRYRDTAADQRRRLPRRPGQAGDPLSQRRHAAIHDGRRGDKQRAGYTARVLAVTETDGMDEAGETQPRGRRDRAARGPHARLWYEQAGLPGMHTVDRQGPDLAGDRQRHGQPDLSAMSALRGVRLPGA